MPKRIVLACVFLFFSLLAGAGQDQNYPFSVETEKEGNGHRVVARNNGPAAVSVRVSITNSLNIIADRPSPIFAVVPPDGGTLYLAHVRPAVSEMKYSFSTQSAWLLGNLNARQSPDAIYRLPYPDGSTHVIGQAPGGPITTHTMAESRYAVDIGLPEGSPVVAARDGIVIHTEAGQVYGAKTPDMLDKANEVRIQHIDGTIGVYAHLAHGGVFVHPGQRVAAGTQIGLAGSTGYSSGPHLHLAVLTVTRSGDDLAMVSLPFQFYVGNPPSVFAPRYGLQVTAHYASPASISTKPQIATQPESHQDAGAPEMVFSFQVPPEIRSWLQRIPMWQWIAGFFAIVVLVMYADKAYQAKRRQRLRLLREPVLHSRPAEEIRRSSLSNRDRLVIACGGDRQSADRLQAYESSRNPEIEHDEAARRAWEKLRRERQ